MLYEKMLGEEKIYTDNDKLVSKLDSLRVEGKNIVFTNGCFDILHLGHIEYLLRASTMGDVLVLGINNDDSIRMLKGVNRPIMSEEHRYHLMAALSFIDFVVPFSDSTPYEIIKHIKPDVLVKGSDYNVEDIVGYDVVKSYGGEISTIETNLPPSIYSTTNIINKIKSID